MIINFEKYAFSLLNNNINFFVCHFLKMACGHFEDYRIIITSSAANQNREFSIIIYVIITLKWNVPGIQQTMQTTRKTKDNRLPEKSTVVNLSKTWSLMHNEKKIFLKKRNSYKHFNSTFNVSALTTPKCTCKCKPQEDSHLTPGNKQLPFNWLLTSTFSTNDQVTFFNSC